MGTLTAVEFEILSAASSDAENLERIYQHVRRSPATLAEVAETVMGLMGQGLLRPVGVEGETVPTDPRLVWRAWFGLTPEGRHALAENPPGVFTGRESRFGSWGNLAADLPIEEFQAVRREMSVFSDQDPSE